jgi:uncharacterized NAD-dependent epimerase/dehydratase family protein
MTSKTANAALRYFPERVVGVLDQRYGQHDVQSLLGFGGAVPVVGSMREGLALRPTAVLIGIAPEGGRLPSAWHAWLLEALDAGCDLWSGLHTRLADDPALAARAAERKQRLVDLRSPPRELPVAAGRAADVDAFVVLTVGTDCNVGKMTAQLQLVADLEARGLRTHFAATGQTGMLVAGSGMPLDAVPADFIAGAAEQLVLDKARGADIVLVEGQGSLNHPGYSAVTLGLLHGSCPDALVLCHQPSRAYLGGYDDPDGITGPAIPSLATYVDWYQTASAMVHPAKVVAVALNTYDLSDEDARRACERAAKDTGLPATDPVRFGSTELVDAVLAARSAAHAGRARRNSIPIARS